MVDFSHSGRKRPENSSSKTGSARAEPAVPAQLPREDAAVWHGAARLLGTAPCTAHCQKPRPSYWRSCAVSTRQSRPLLRAAPRQRGRFFIIFGPLSAICCLRISRSPRLPRCMTAHVSAVCCPGFGSASTNTRSRQPRSQSVTARLALGAIAHARGGEWQDFGRSGAWLRCADLDHMIHAAPKPWAGMVHHSTGSPRLTPG